MALPLINAACFKCNSQFTVEPKRSFLGFQTFGCPSCQEKLIYPLTTGFRGIYLVLLGYMAFMLVTAVSLGGYAYPGGIGLAIIVALSRDRLFRKRIQELIKKHPTNEHFANIDTAINPKLNKWNYAGITLGVTLLLFVFLPQIMNGTLENQHYIGVAFWVAIIIYSAMNIFKETIKKNKSSK